MKFLLAIFSFAIVYSCSENKSSTKSEKNTNKQAKLIVKKEFRSILDSTGFKGSILIFDFNKQKFYSSDFRRSKKGFLPASTFKIPNSIIGLETGVISDTTIFKWSGDKRMFKSWEQDLNLKQAFHFSCVPCYQEVARKIGEKRMKRYLDKLNYHKMDVDSSNIDLFWLVGDSKISQFKQIDFLKRFYLNQLSISKSTFDFMKDMMVIQKTEVHTLSGKTGLSMTGEPLNQWMNGWFVGYLEKDSNVFFCATNLEAHERERESFVKARKQVTLDALDVISEKK
jgi:beta-lactamase class D